MLTAHDFLVNLALVLCVAALATVVFQLIRQPVVLGVRLDPGHAALGCSPIDLNLRSRTGATVLAITRGGSHPQVPTGREVLEAGDVLALGGTSDAIVAAAALLAEAPAGDGAA